jgi:2-polyprenyl-3-methyl-5-hydroxy-6-metoxy-1,4-benzoquinol methylase
MRIPKSVRKNEYGFYEVAVKPTPAELDAYYADKYYQDCVAANYPKAYTADELIHINNKSREHSAVIRRYFKSDLVGKRFLDVGCGEGFDLKHFKLEGCMVLGLDYSEYAIQSHNPDMLAYFHQCDIIAYNRQLIEKKAKFDIISIDNVLEHVIDPVGLLRDVWELLAVQGVLRIQVPNDFSVCQEELLRLRKVNRSYSVYIPEHLSYFNFESLKKLLKELNFRVITIMGDYPIEFYLFNEKTNYVRDRSVGKYCNESRVLTENFLYQANFKKTIKLYEVMGEIGIGRQMTFYVTKGHTNKK